MRIDRTAVRLGFVVAAVGVFAQAADVALFFLVMFDVVTIPVETTGLPFFEGWTWDFLASWVADRVTQGVLLVALVAAFYASFPEDRDGGPVVAGFAVAAAAYGAGIVATRTVMLPWIVSPGPLAEYARLTVWLALLFGGVAALGALGGDAVGPLFRSPDGSDDPRW